MLFVSLPVTTNRFFINPEGFSIKLKGTGRRMILVAQDPTCVEALFSDSCAGGESVIGEKG
jgi:hypothetical protein